ncbi:MAG: pirin family protein [Pseudomonadales bacterium]
MRALQQLLNAQATKDGDGVSIHRLAGRNLHQALNPFLMIDEINSDDAADYVGGFPEHPHRGFETITYMKAGRMRHRDHMGNEGVIAAGDVQWMTAGAGVLHSEIPEQEQGLLHGFQIWLNLPAAEKMKPAAYQEIASIDVTEQELPDGGRVKVIAGKVEINQHTLQGPLPDISTQPVFLDVRLAANETVALSFNEASPALVYVYGGKTDQVLSRQLGVYSSGETLQLSSGPEGADVLILSGQAIDESIAQYGPFVMNTIEEVEQAINDFQDPDYLDSLSSGRKMA